MTALANQPTRNFDGKWSLCLIGGMFYEPTGDGNPYGPILAVAELTYLAALRSSLALVRN
ncbi:MAG: hypothetical protein M3315_00895 [Actinomycetota bacterium]|nr:hypothetical protein [Actinomycetota bacterium]